VPANADPLALGLQAEHVIWLLKKAVEAATASGLIS
jgi:hypothetical protein